jgi:DNA-binding NtrC family response regulator
MGEESKTAVRAIETGERKDRVLIVEDEDNARKGYEQLLQKWGCDVLGVASAEDALAKFASYQPDSLIADVELPGMNGLDLLKQLGSELLDVPAIIITGKGSEERAVAAIEAGAFWYIEKPLKAPVLRALLDRALEKARGKRQLAVLQRQLRETGRLGDLVGGSKPMQQVAQLGVCADHRRNRIRQRNRRPHHSQAFPARVRAVHRHQLLGYSGNLDGK